MWLCRSTSDTARIANAMHKVFEYTQNAPRFTGKYNWEVIPMNYQEKIVSLLDPYADYDIKKLIAYGWYITEMHLTYVVMRFDLRQPIPSA